MHLGDGNAKHSWTGHGKGRETENVARVLKSHCSAADPLPKLTAMGAASGSFQKQLNLCSFFRTKTVKRDDDARRD